MAYYKTSPCTLNDVLKQHPSSTAATTTVASSSQTTIDNMDSGTRVLMKQLLFDVGDELMLVKGRTFVPYIETVTVYPSMPAWANWRYERGILRYYLQDLLYADLLSLSSVEVDDTAIVSSYYRLEGSAPFDAVTFDPSGITLPSGSSFTSKVEFAGTWGYHENPSALWSSIGTLQASLNSSATDFVATAPTVASFEVYQYLKIDDEILFVTAVNSSSPYTITVERGARGSTAAAHDSAAVIYAYQQMPDVTKAARRRVINLMQKRAETANLVQIGEGVVEASTESIDLHIPARYVPVKAI